MEFARETQNPALLKEILSASGADSLDALARILSRSAGQEALPQLIDLAVEVAAAERGFLLEANPDRVWNCRIARNLDGEDIRNPLDKVILPLVERAMEQGLPWCCCDVSALPDRDRWDRERMTRTTAVHLVPLDDSRLLYLDHRFQTLQDGIGDNPTLTVALLGVQTLLASEVETSSVVQPRKDVISKGETSTGTGGTEEVAIIGEDADIISVQQLISRVAPSQASILITGESGTGKELAARSIHQHSDRSTGPFISENCGAIAENLLESELFGCMKGAFTGATLDRPGLFELAHGGTIFLDEIGDTSPGLQKKLLRVIQEGVVRRVGGQETIQVDVRILSATNRDLSHEVQDGRFREDLYYRLNVINVHLPPLRERGSDVSLLAQHFLDGLNEEAGTNKTLNPPLKKVLLAHSWPGNIRELQNEIRRVHALGADDLDAADLSPRVTEEDSTVVSPAAGEAGLDRIRQAGSLKDAIEQLEAQWISDALQRCNGHRGQVCQWLGIPKTTLYAKMRRYGLSTDG